MSPVWRYKLFYLIIPIYFGLFVYGNENQPLQLQQQQNVKTSGATSTTTAETIIDTLLPGSMLLSAGRSLFSPRVDYNEWMPVGYGDPLKKDPTYDYSPPVLDRVRYWGEQNKDKKDILLLGVVAKRSHNNNNNNNNNNRKETKHSTAVRRNYYSQQLPTVLMPPPMQPPIMNLYSQQQFTSNPIENSQPHFTTQHNNNNNNNWSQSQYSDTIGQESTSNYVTINKYSTDQASPQYHHQQYSKENDVKELSIAGDNKAMIAENQSNNNNNNNNNINDNIIQSKYKTPWIHALLQKEVTKPSTSSTAFVVMAQSPTTFEKHSSGFVKNIYDKQNFIENDEPLTTYFTPTIRPPAAVATTELHEPPPPLSDAQFINNNLMANYPPMYLIIQGHSKVKTYGQLNPDSAEYDHMIKHLPKIVPVPESDEPIKTHVVSTDENGENLEVKHLHTKTISNTADNKLSTNNKDIPSLEKSSMGDLMSLLDNSFGDFFFQFNDNQNDNNTKINSIIDVNNDNDDA